MISNLLSTIWQKMLAGLMDFLQQDLPKIILAVLIMLGASFLARKAEEIVFRALQRSKADKGITILLKNITRWIVFGTGIFISLGLFVNVSSLLTTLGLVTFAITFAFQDVLKNLVSGIIILIQHPFKVGEAVSIGGFEGTVVSIATRMTEIDCFDGRSVAIPNGNAISDPIINFTRSPKRRVDLPMRLPYGTEMGVLRDAIFPAVEEVPGYLAEPAPMVTFDLMNELSLGVTVYFWVDTTVLGSMLVIRDRAIQSITRSLAEKGIVVPVPIQSVLAQGEQN